MAGGIPAPAAATFPETLRPPLRWASQLVWPLAEAMPPSAESPPPIIPPIAEASRSMVSTPAVLPPRAPVGVFRVASVSLRECRTAANAGIAPIRHKDLPRRLLRHRFGQVRQRSPSREPLLRSSGLHPRCRAARSRRIASHSRAPYAPPRTGLPPTPICWCSFRRTATTIAFRPAATRAS